MQKVTLKRYAQKNKMSLFSVVKLVKSGKLQSTTEQEDGKEVTYILEEESFSQVPTGKKGTETNTQAFDCEEAFKKLSLEVRVLKEELAKLKQSNVRL